MKKILIATLAGLMLFFCFYNVAFAKRPFDIPPGKAKQIVDPIPVPVPIGATKQIVDPIPVPVPIGATKQIVDPIPVTVPIGATKQIVDPIPVPVPIGASVRDFGAMGNGIADDTAAIQRAIDSAGVVYVPDGVYLVNVDTPIQMRSNSKLNMADNATLKGIPTVSEVSAVIWIGTVSGVEITGGNIIGERYGHIGTTGEWGHGIKIQGGNNISVSDIAISDCWGDGIYVNGSELQAYSNTVSISRVTLNNNRRQGISIISAKNLLFKDSTASNTNGTLPASGLDLEPNLATEFLQNIVIDNFQTTNNKGYGITSYFPSGLPKENVDITIKNHRDIGSAEDMGNIYKYINDGWNITVI